MNRSCLAGTYLEKSIALLKEASGKGFFKSPGTSSLLKDDTDLDALRDRADFRELLSNIEEKPPEDVPQ